MMSRVSNDDLGDEQYENLVAVLGLDADKVLSPTERMLVSAEMLHVLNDVPEWDRWEENHEHRSKRDSGGSGSENDAATDEDAGDDEEDGDYSRGYRAQSKAEVSQLDGPMTPKPKRDSQRVQARGTGKSSTPVNAGTGKASRSGKHSVVATKVAGRLSRVSGTGKSPVAKGKKPYKCSLPKSEVNFVRAVSNFRVRNPVTRG